MGALGLGVLLLAVNSVEVSLDIDYVSYLMWNICHCHLPDLS